MQVPSPEMCNKTLTGTLESLHVGVKECKGWFSQTLPWEELIYGQESVVSCTGKLRICMADLRFEIQHWQIHIATLSLVCSMELSIIISMFQSLKVNLLTKQRMKTSAGLRMRTSLCYNPTLERMTCAIFQAEGVEVRTYFMVDLLGLGKGLPFFLWLCFSLTQNLSYFYRRCV